MPADDIHRGEEFDWERQPNRRDHVIDLVLQPTLEQNATCVKSVTINTVGGLNLDLSHDLKYETFPDESGEGEKWRILQPKLHDVALVADRTEDGDVLFTGRTWPSNEAPS